MCRNVPPTTTVEQVASAAEEVAVLNFPEDLFHFVAPVQGTTYADVLVNVEDAFPLLVEGKFIFVPKSSFEQPDFQLADVCMNRSNNAGIYYIYERSKFGRTTEFRKCRDTRYSEEGLLGAVVVLDWDNLPLEGLEIFDNLIDQIYAIINQAHADDGKSLLETLLDMPTDEIPEWEDESGGLSFFSALQFGTVIEVDGATLKIGAVKGMHLNLGEDIVQFKFQYDGVGPPSLAGDVHEMYYSNRGELVADYSKLVQDDLQNSFKLKLDANLNVGIAGSAFNHFVDLVSWEPGIEFAVNDFHDVPEDVQHQDLHHSVNQIAERHLVGLHFPEASLASVPGFDNFVIALEDDLGYDLSDGDQAVIGQCTTNTCVSVYLQMLSFESTQQGQDGQAVFKSSTDLSYDSLHRTKDSKASGLWKDAFQRPTPSSRPYDPMSFYNEDDCNQSIGRSKSHIESLQETVGDPMTVVRYTRMVSLLLLALYLAKNLLLL